MTDETTVDVRVGEGSADPDEEPQIDELFLQMIARFKAHVRRGADRLGLSVLQFIALRHIDDPIPMGQLAEVLFSDPSVMTAVADGLEERGYVERQVSAEDRRVKELVLTEAGRAAKRRVHESMMRDNPVFGALTGEERATLVRLLAKMAGVG